MKLDIATLSFILCTTSIIQVIGIYFQAKLNKSFNGTKYWVFGNVFNAIGVLLFFMRPFISNNFISIILANALVIFAQILIYIGIALFLNKEVKYKIIITIFLISTIAILYFLYINNNSNWRTISLSIAMAFNSFLIAFELLRDKNNSIKNSSNFLGSIFLFYGVFYVIRSISILFYDINSFFDPSIMQASAFVISISVSYFSSFSLIIMVNQRVRSEEREAQERFQLIFETSPEATDINKVEDGLIMNANDKIKIFSQAMEQSPASIVITDLTGNIEYVNKRFTDITGYSYEDVIGKNPRILKSDYHSMEDYDKLWKDVLTGKEWSGEFRNKKKNGKFYWESAIISPIFDNEGKIKKIIAIKEDISERKRLESELKKQARTDGLTGLSNRRYFVEAVENELFINRHYIKECAFLMLDIDNFKRVNDNFGHAIGDIAIKKVADVFIETIRKTDILGRIGGEEFAMLLVETNFEDAIKTAERLRLNVENIKLFDNKGVQVKLTISIGIAKYSEERNSLEDLMICSDKALYRAKNEGRNRVVSIE